MEIFIPKMTVIAAYLINRLKTKISHDENPRVLSTIDLSEWLWKDASGELRVQVFSPNAQSKLQNRDQLIVTGSKLDLPIAEGHFSAWCISQVDEVIDRISLAYR